QNKNCRNCHALEGVGGKRGPDLTFVGARLTRDQLIDQISNGTPGGGNMPAYGKQMRPAEMTALVAFLVARRAGNEPEAKDPSTPQAHDELAKQAAKALAIAGVGIRDSNSSDSGSPTNGRSP